MAERDERVAVAVGPVAGEPHLVAHRSNPAAPRACRLRDRSSRGSRRRAGAAAGGERPLDPAPAQRGAAEAAHEALADIGLVDHAEHRPSAAVEADQRSPGRRAAEEGPGAVDRVEHPGQAGPALHGSELLARRCHPRAAIVSRARIAARPRGRPRSPGRTRSPPCSPPGAPAPEQPERGRRGDVASARRPGRDRSRVPPYPTRSRPPPTGPGIALPRTAGGSARRARTPSGPLEEPEDQATSLSTRARSNSRRRCASGIA